MRVPLLIAVASIGLASLGGRVAHACVYPIDYEEVDVPTEQSPNAPGVPLATVADVEVRRGADLESRDGCSQVSSSCADSGSVRFNVLDKDGEPFDSAVAYRIAIDGAGADDFWWPQGLAVMPVSYVDEHEFVLRFWDRDQDLDVTISITPIGPDGQAGEPALVAVSDSLGGCRVARRSSGLGLGLAVALAGLALTWRRRTATA